MENFFRKLWDIIFPPLCLGCKKIILEEKKLFICQNCFFKLKINFHFFCPLCKARLPGLKNTCHKKTNFVLGSPFNFQDKEIKNIIHNLKYTSAKKAAFTLGFFTVEYLIQIPSIENLKKSCPEITLLPVPLHKIKERKRGFNQALLIAEGIKFWKEKLDINNILPKIQINKNFILKTKNTPSQTEQKSEKEREENIKGSFGLNKNITIESKCLAIVDDVFTSGATVKEIIKTIRTKYPYKRIIVLTAAKTN